jgi:hypothetical protein
VITKIETPSVSRGDGKFSYFDEYEANGVLDLRFRSGAAEFHQYSTDNDRPAKLMYDTDTIFMTVPKDDSVDYADERCARLQDVTNYVETGGSYEMHGYITDGSKLKCDIILFAVSNDETDSDERWFKRQRSMVVDKVSYSLNNEGKSGVLIEGMENKKRAAYVSSGKSIIDHSTGKPITIVPGDIVQVKVNVYGDIESVRRIYNKTKDTYGDGISYTTNADYTNDARVVLGNVYSTDGPFFSIVEDSKKNHTNKGRYAEIIKTTTPYAYVYVYDNETKKVSLGTYKDIINDSRVVYVYIKEGTINDIVVYR